MNANGHDSHGPISAFPNLDGSAGRRPLDMIPIPCVIESYELTVQ